MKQKSIRIVITLVLLVLVGFGVWQYFKKGIELEKVSADLHIIGKDRLDIDMDILIDTRFFWETKVYSIAYQMKLGESVILEGEQEFDTLIIDNNRRNIPLQLSLNPQKIRSVVDSLQITDSTYLEFEYLIDYHLPVLGQNRSHNTKLKKVQVPIPPEVKLENLELDEFKLSEPLSINARVLVTNYSKIALSIEGLEYSFMVEENEWASGKLEKPISIDSSGQSYVNLPLKVSHQKVGKRLWQRFISRDSIHYSIRAKGDLDLNIEKVDLQNIDFELEGVY